VFYTCLAILLLIQSFSALWPFPDLLPVVWSTKAWGQVLSAAAPIVTSLALGLATATVGLAATVAWLESSRPPGDRIVLFACGLALCLPALVIALGQYRLFLVFDMAGTIAALFLAHILPVTAYVFVVLHGPYRGFDGRWRAVSSGLMQSRGKFLLRIKWPLLKAPLLAAFAVGFAVSLAQYVPAQVAAAGRFSTLPMEAVTLSSGGNRALLAVHALSLTVFPLIVFVLPGFFGRARWAR